jgi:hypothetical protein
MVNVASQKIIKDELSTLTNKELIAIILRMTRFRKENKELLTYLLFDSRDEQEYVRLIKNEIETALSIVTSSNAGSSMKLIRRVLRNTRKAIKFSGKDETEVQLLLHYCSILKGKNLPFARIKALNAIWSRCILNIGKAIASLHEDLRYDYGMELKALIEGEL